MVDRTLGRLARVNCELAVVNLHHLGDQITQALGERRLGVPIHYAPEETILGTLGPLAAARDQLRDADVVLLINGDALCAWPFEKLIRRHVKTGSAATLLVHAGIDPARYGGGLGLDRSSRVVAMREARPIKPVACHRVFTGAHALSPRLLDQLAEGTGDIVSDLYIPMLRDGQTIETASTRRRWHDLGTPHRYWEGVLNWARGPWPRAIWRGNRVAPGALVDPGARVRRSVIESGATINSGARVESSVLLEGSRVGVGSEIRDCVIGPGVTLEKAHLEDRLVTVKTPGHHKSAEESVLGSLVYSPLGAR